MSFRRLRKAAQAGLFGLALIYVYTLGPAMHAVHGRLPWPLQEGGLSGLDIDDTGAFVAVSDTGMLYQGHIDRDKDGKLSQARLISSHRLQDQDGVPLQGHVADAEDVKVWGDRLLISYENPNRVWAHDGDGAVVERLPSPPGFDELTPNFGFEAVSLLPNGEIIVLAENMIGPAANWIFDGKQWHSQDPLGSRLFYAVTAADVGPDGRLYVLERGFFGIGFAARVRRLDAPGAKPQTVVTLPLWRVGNAEGLAITQTGANMRLTIITDNNNLPLLQRSEFVEILIPKG